MKLATLMVFVLAAAMAVPAVAETQEHLQATNVTVAKAFTTPETEFTWTTNADNTVIVTRYTGHGGEVVIPERINGLPVTSIGKEAFSLCTKLTKVTVSVGITNIGSHAFVCCDGLTNVTMPEGVVNIGNAAFLNCTKLDNVMIPNSVASIGESSFESCGLTSMTIPICVTNIGDGAFLLCSRLSNITIPASVCNIGASAFGLCTSLTNITIPVSVANIGELAFSNCRNLTGVYFKGTVPAVGEGVFIGTTNATVYYLEGSTGWSKDFGGRPTAVWRPEGGAATQGNTTSLSTNLVLVRVATIPYKLRFKTESDFPVGSNWNGFVAVKYMPKMKSRTFPDGTTGTVDVSELTLERGNRTVVLVKGETVNWMEQTVGLFDQTDMKTYSLRTGEETTIGGSKLRLQTVDPTGMKCTLVDCVTGEQIMVVRPPSVSTSSVDVATGFSVFRQQQEVVYGEWSCVETNRHQVNDLDWKTVTTTRQFFGTNAYMKVVQTDHTNGSQTVGGQTLCRTYFGDYWIARNELTVRCVDTRSHVPAVINATFSFAISGNLMVVTNRDTGDVHRFHRMGTTNDTTGAWSREPM